MRLQYADLWQLGDGFKNWIETENDFCNTLVDRIVTGYPRDEAEELGKQIGYEDKLIDTAEIFHLWSSKAITRTSFPSTRPATTSYGPMTRSPIRREKSHLKRRPYPMVLGTRDLV